MNIIKNVLLTLSLLAAFYSPSASSMEYAQSIDIFKAIEKGDETRILQIISEDPDIVNLKRPGRNLVTLTPLLWATACGKANIVKKLIAKGADVHFKDDSGQTPLHVAARKGFSDVAQELINANANINTQDNSGATPLYCAAKNGRNVVVETLLDAGAVIDMPDTNGLMPEQLATECGQDDTARLLKNFSNQLTQRKYLVPKKHLKPETISTEENHFSDFFTNGSNAHIAKNILGNLGLKDLAHLRATNTEINKSPLIADDIETQALMREQIDPIGYLEQKILEQKDTAFKYQAMRERLIELGADLARLGTESENGQYQVLKERPKRAGYFTGEQRLDICECHYVQPSSKDSNQAIIERIDSLYKANPHDSFFLMLDSSSENRSRRLDKSFIRQLANYPIIGLYLSDVIFDDDNGGANIVHLLENFHHLHELIIINPKDLSLKTEVIDKQAFINNSSLFDSVSKLTELRVLILQKTNLFSIPEGIGNLKNLRYLDLSHNDIDLIAPAIGSLKKLVTLNLIQNSLERLQPAMRELTQLRTLRIAENLFTTESLKDIPLYFPNLRVFDIKAMETLMSLPDETGNLKKLKILNISRNSISKLPLQIRYLKELLKIDMTFTQLDQAPTSLKELPKLSELHLSAKIVISWELLEQRCATMKDFVIFFDDVDAPIRKWAVERLKPVIEIHKLIKDIIFFKRKIEKNGIKNNTNADKLAMVARISADYNYLTNDSIDGYGICHLIREPNFDRLEKDLNDLLTQLKTIEKAKNRPKKC